VGFPVQKISLGSCLEEFRLNLLTRICVLTLVSLLLEIYKIDLYGIHLWKQFRSEDGGLDREEMR